MADYAWFPLDLTTTPRYTYFPTGNFSNGAFWANLTTLTNPPVVGTVPGSSDNVYIVAGNVFSGLGFPPPPNPLPPYPVALTINAGATETIASLGLAGYARFAANLQPTLDIESASLVVTGAVADHFTKTFPKPIGTQSASNGGTIVLGAGATLEIGATVDSLIQISFADGFANRLLLDSPGTLNRGAFSGTIQNFLSGDFIDLSSVPLSGASETFNSGVLTISTMLFPGFSVPVATLKFSGAYTTASFQLVDNGSRQVEIIVCFAAGTRISTPEGEVAVEDLRPGDAVATLRDHVRVASPVTWIGRRRVNLAHHRDVEQVAPILIRRDAFTQGVPARDLRVSPDHCLFIDGGLIPARLLINGATIVQETGLRAVEYFHVELAAHSVLLAEGLPAESYLDTGNRAFFANAGTVIALHPQSAANLESKSWQQISCAPLTVDAATVEPVWRRLAARAENLGFECPALQTGETEGGLRLLADGREIRPAMTDGDRHWFALPPGTDSVRLMSGAQTPSRMRPWLDDRRRLGVCVGQILVRTETGAQEIPVDHPGLSQGWWTAERDGARFSRWTNGNAVISLPPQARIVELRVIAGITTLRAGNGHATAMAMRA